MGCAGASASSASFEKPVAKPSSPSEAGVASATNETAWFEKLFGAQEASYEETKALFAIERQADTEFLVAPNGRRFQPGRFENRCLGDLRKEALRLAGAAAGQLEVENVVGDVREMHGLAESSGAVFQVASQLNCLEFVNSSVTPEDGISGYGLDHTQGPACALACAASTVWRNYFVPMGDPGSGELRGQTKQRQINNLSDVQALLKCNDDCAIEVRNGYSFCENVDDLSKQVERLSAEEQDALRAAFRVGIQWDAEVTDNEVAPGTKSSSTKLFVTQVFCSALALGSSPKLRLWQPLAQLVLDAAYEATFAIAACNRARDGQKDVYLTLLGGGAFGNGPKWIEAAIKRALDLYQHTDLRIRIVHLSEHSPWFAAYDGIAKEWGAGKAWRLERGVWSPIANDLQNGDDEDSDEPAPCTRTDLKLLTAMRNREMKCQGFDSASPKSVASPVTKAQVPL